MDVYGGALRSRKRNTTSKGNETLRFPLHDLNEDLLERVLSWLPTSSFLRLTSVCKRWKSVSHSAAFMLACSQVPSRRPWFFMIDSHSHHQQQPVVFDSDEGNWKKLNNPPPPLLPTTPIAAAGGLLCFLRPDGGFIVTNPVTATCCHIDPPSPAAAPQPIRAIAMAAKRKGFEIVLVSGELPSLNFRVYTSLTQQWGEESSLTRKSGSGGGVDCAPYFLSKCGNVVTTNTQRSPSKQYSSILIDGDGGGGKILYFLSSAGAVVACDLCGGSFFEYPRLLPVFSEYSIDLVECGGRMWVVLLSEFLETASLRVWGWDEAGRCWKQAAAMPPCMSRELYGKKADVNCAGGGGKVLVCVSSGESCRYVMCDLGENEWAELPQCSVDGRRREFVSAFSFEPRIEVDFTP
ncbi:F-box only protein 13 [Salvia divinorum]|uniref:F-box only protein 13 n=1 Tax=Salvia divinorum TaxID=28513 RepID=A0ABD1H7W4_SALDI